MFEDKRSKKVILVAHCVINQNAKLDQCAHYPGTIREISDILIKSDVGIIQMPCPELSYLGLDREVDKNESSTVESEDTRIAQRMLEEKGQVICHEIVKNLTYQIQQYKKNGFKVLGILGINGSPTCGVESTWSNNQEIKGQGVFIKMLIDELNRYGISLPITGVKVREIKQEIKKVRDLLKII